MRDDETLDFDWGDGSPGAGITPDRFMARWTKTVVLSAGVYRFSGVRDDGIRAYIDNMPVVDKWSFGSARLQRRQGRAERPARAARRVLRGQAAARAPGSPTTGSATSCRPTAATPPSTSPTGTSTGAPVLTRPDDAVDFDWGGGAPGDGVPADNFSARWTKSLTVDGGRPYKFTVTSDDGARLYVDGQKVLDKWINQGPTTYTVDATVDRGRAPDRDGVLRGRRRRRREARYEPTAEPPPPPPPEPFAAEYFDNSDLSGAPVLTRTDDAIDFDWGEGAPEPGGPADRFSARWTRTKAYAAGTYRFSVTGDDGIRVLVDGSGHRRLVLPGADHLHRRCPAVRGPAHRGRRVLRAHRRRGGQVQRVEAGRAAAVAPMR